MPQSWAVPDVTLAELSLGRSTPLPTKRAYCVDLGCSENRLDGSLMRRYLERNAWAMVDDPTQADLIIVNSCGFTETSERASLDTYQELARAKQPGARIIFAGCLPAMNQDAIRATGYDDVFVTPRTLSRLDDITKAESPIGMGEFTGCIPHSSDGLGASFTFEYDDVQRFLKRVAAALVSLRIVPVPRWLWQFMMLPDGDVEFIRISVGCLNRCSFCSIPQAKGATRSVPLDVVLQHVREALRRGKHQIALSCDELASYGQDLGTDIVTLLDRITGVPGDFRLILRNVHPEWILKYWEGLRPVFQRGKISYLIIPVQSGSDRILRMMRRNHTADEYRRLIVAIREASPSVIIRTHFIVGFPGETEKDFRDTRVFARDLPVDSFCIHEYSDRRKTTSAGMTDKIDPAVIRRRAGALKLDERKGFFRTFRWFPLRPNMRPQPLRPTGA